MYMWGMFSKLSDLTYALEADQRRQMTKGALYIKKNQYGRTEAYKNVIEFSSLSTSTDLSCLPVMKGSSF